MVKILKRYSFSKRWVVKLLTFFVFGLFFNASAANAQSEINFYQNNFDSVASIAKSQQKPVLLYFTAEWCLPCRQMDKTTFADSEFINYANQTAFVYKADVDYFVNMDLADRYAVNKYPSMVLFDKRGKLSETMIGYQSKDELQEALKRAN